MAGESLQRGTDLCQIVHKHCALTNVAWCDFHDSHYAVSRRLSNEHLRARERENERVGKQKEREGVKVKWT